MRILSIQVAIFFENEVDRPDKFIETINNEMDNVFDKMPVILPIPKDAPGEIPVITMESSIEHIRLSISRNRSDLFIDAFDIDFSVDNSLEKYEPLCKRFLKGIVRCTNVTRIGVVVTIFKEDKDPLGAIKTKYLKTDLKQVGELSIKYNDQSKQNGLDMNNIYEISNTEILFKEPLESKRGIVAMIDINNVAGEVVINQKLEKILKYAFDRFQESKVAGVI